MPMPAPTQIQPPGSSIFDGRIPTPPSRKYYIAGTWCNNYTPEEMKWDGKNYVYSVTIGSKGFESFQILESANWDKVIYPSATDAHPYMNYYLLGPDGNGFGMNWTIGWRTKQGHPKNATRPGLVYKVSLSMDGAKPKWVTWSGADIAANLGALPGGYPKAPGMAPVPKQAPKPAPKAAGAGLPKSPAVPKSMMPKAPAAMQSPVAPRTPYSATTADKKSTTAAELAKLTSVLYWGICDVKYDARLPEDERVKVLELGEGSTSAFSQHGSAIRERFEQEYRMVEKPLRRALLVENKKLTHDHFVREGFGHLRPRAKTYLRHYTKDLADEICNDLGECPMVVLKLVNRCRGAGVVVAPREKLDGMLCCLLEPPAGADFNTWLKRKADRALADVLVPKSSDETFEEQCLHWWSNECPVFIAERCCHSHPVKLVRASLEEFDGTMRVSWVLRGKGGQGGAEQLEVDFLGGYWKLPRLPVPRDAKDSTTDAEAARARVVSSFNSAEKRTADVPEKDLKVVFDALRPALPVVFGGDEINSVSLQLQYEGEPVFLPYIMARAAAGTRLRSVGKAKVLLKEAHDAIRNVREGKDTVPAHAVMSYIARNLGICELMETEFTEASHWLAKSLEPNVGLPTNSTAHYCHGRYHDDKGRIEEAAQCMRKSIALDPDFKLPYVALGTCLLRLRKFPEVVEASKACLVRHPDSVAAQFNLGQAFYHMAQRAQVPKEKEAAVWKEAEAALAFAKAKASDSWVDADEQMLKYFRCRSLAERQEIPKQTVHTWLVSGWRP
mmetsp:Transcript_92408/g.198090  ORF Transcript_92408/g.198090 Transcript_92408/m.198090 type:complete len:784 (-) Transcript_92408:167-2518(-)